METTKKEHRNGYAILKEKFAKQELKLKHLKIELAEKDGKLKKKDELITELKDKAALAEQKVLTQQAKYNKLIDEMYVHMGWFRRWLWDMKHANKKH